MSDVETAVEGDNNDITPLPIKVEKDEVGRAVLPEALIDPISIFNKQMVLPGIDGLPFRGETIPNLKEVDGEALRPKVGTLATTT